VKEGVGLAVGLFLSALTNVGLFTLTSTPLKAGSTILDLLKRPSNEKLFLLMPVGYPDQRATVPYRSEKGVPLRKKVEEIHTYYD
jgi:iodotyrosine deiodinase